MQTPIPNRDLSAAIEDSLATNPVRIYKFEHGTKTYWIKRVETLTPRMRLLKGDPAVGFEKERAALKYLASKSVPVPAIIDEGTDYFVLSDSGPSVLSLMHSNSSGQKTRETVLVEAAQALADLHRQDIAHGRPAIRDMTYRNGKITFLDFENFDETPATPRRKFRDLLIFAHSLYRWSNADLPEIDACLEAYRKGQPEVWQEASKWCRRNRWINVITRPLQTLKRRGKDFRPIPFLFRKFA